MVASNVEVANNLDTSIETTFIMTPANDSTQTIPKTSPVSTNLLSWEQENIFEREPKNIVLGNDNQCRIPRC